jgi:hypothetical protein
MDGVRTSAGATGANERFGCAMAGPILLGLIALLWILAGHRIINDDSSRGMPRGSVDSVSSVGSAYLDQIAPTQVVYEVIGTPARVDITFQTPAGRSHMSAVALPMTDKQGASPALHYSGFLPSEALYIAAENPGAFGTLTCRIKLNGVVISENTASGSHAIATCEGSV